MVQTVERTNEQINESLRAYPGKETSGRNSDPNKTETKRGRGRPRKQPAAAAATEQENIPRMVTLEVPEPEAPKTAAPKKKAAAKKAAANKTMTAENISGVLKASFDIIGNREGLEIWKLDEKECNQLAEPLAKIISKNAYLEKITEQYGEYIGLIIAISMVIIPRLLLQMKINKEKQKTELEKKREKKINDKRTTEPRTESNQNRTPGTSDRAATQPTSGGVAYVDPQFHKSFPTIQL